MGSIAPPSARSTTHGLDLTALLIEIPVGQNVLMFCLFYLTNFVSLDQNVCGVSTNARKLKKKKKRQRLQSQKKKAMPLQQLLLSFIFTVGYNLYEYLIIII